MTIIKGSRRADTLSGGEEDDVIFGNGGNDAVSGGGGADRLSGDGGDDTLYGDGGDDRLDGGDGDDVLIDGDGSTRFFGRAGADRIIADYRYYNGGNAIYSVAVDGGDGNDVVLISASQYGFAGTRNAVTVDLGAGDDMLTLTEGAYARWSDVTLGAGQDRVTVRDEPVTTGFDSGIDFRDFAAGLTGDVLDLSSLLVRQLADWDGSNPFGASGYLQLVQVDADAWLQIDRDGAAGSGGFADLVRFRSTDGPAFTAENFAGLRPDGQEATPVNLTGTNHEDTLTGTSSSDVIRGAGGQDKIDGGGSSDSLFGDASNDTIDGNLGDDVILGGNGDDVASGGNSADRITGGAGSDTLFGNAGDDRLDGGDGDDALIDGEGSTRFFGGDGVDRITADYRYYNGGNAIYSVVVDGGDGNDVVEVRATQYGFAGTRNAVTIDLGSGDDMLTLTEGTYARWSDVTLGTGHDQVAVLDNPVTTSFTSGIDFRDFQAGAAGDVLDLSSLLERQLVDWDGSNPFGASSYLRLVEVDADTWLQIDRDGAAGSGGFADLVRFRSTDAAAFTDENFAGTSDPSPASAARTLPIGTELSSYAIWHALDSHASLV